MKSIDTLPLATGRLRTDQSLQRERELLDEIVRRPSGAVPASTPGLDEARGETDFQFAAEREARERALADCSKELREQRKARASADKALADRESLLATFGHDMKNLLSVLALNAELLTREGQGKLQSLEDLKRTVRRMDRLVSNLLELARLKAGTFHVALDRRDAADVITEAVKTFRPLALARSLSLDAILPNTVLPVRIDPDRIFQVLSNLFSNAIDVSPRGGSIRVSAAKVNGKVLITVRDSGRGIADADLERIFQPYCQLDRANRRGLGLGLFISKSIVQAHGGQIWAESKIGGGSTFFFTVPGIQGVTRREPRASLEAVAV